jgi:hypothetical protein
MYNFIWININNYSLYYFILYKKLLDWIISMVIFGFEIRIGYFPLLNYYDDEINEEKDTKIESLKKGNSNNDSKVNTKLVIKIFFSWEYTKFLIMQVSNNIFIYLISVTMRLFGEIVKGLIIKYLKTLSLIKIHY